MDVRSVLPVWQIPRHQIHGTQELQNADVLEGIQALDVITLNLFSLRLDVDHLSCTHNTMK